MAHSLRRIVGCTLVVLGLSVTAFAREVTIAWDANTETELAGYILRYGTASGDYTAAVDVGNRTDFVLSLDDLTTYYFAVEAYDVNGEHSPLSSEIVLGPNYSMCDFNLNRSSVSVGAAQSSLTVGLTTDPVCPWNASSYTSWVTVNGRTVTAGWGTVSMTIAANTTGMTRVGSLTIAGRLLLVTQAGGSSASAPVYAPDPSTPLPSPAILRAAAKADFNADLKADLLWRRTDGALALWRMNGLTAFARVALNPGVVDPAWKIVGTGDLDGNGRPEIIWQQANGALCAWFMDGATMRTWGFLNPRRVDPAWQVVGVGDMNGDARADIILQHTSGALVVWYMRGVDMIRFAYITPGTPGDRSWSVIGAGDLNGDGQSELVLQHRVSGDLVAWFMNGATMRTWGYLSPRAASGTDWSVGAIADLNGDGKSDLVWQHTSGIVAAWLMNGTRAVSMPALIPNTVTSTWRLAAPR